MRRIEEEQLKIFYYFMLADGKCSDKEKEMFYDICTAMKIEPEERDKLMEICDLAIDANGEDNSERVIKIIKMILEEKRKVRNVGFLVGMGGGISIKRNLCIETMWNLINLGYADREFSEAEKKVVGYLKDYWKIDDILLGEMIDTAEAMLSLVNMKEWVKTTSKSYDEIEIVIKEAENNMKKLEQNIRIAMFEAIG